MTASWYHLPSRNLLWCEGDVREVDADGCLNLPPTAILLVGFAVVAPPPRKRARNDPDAPAATPAPDVLRILDAIVAEPTGVYIVPAVGGVLYTRGRDALVERHLLAAGDEAPAPAPADCALRAGLHGVAVPDDRPLLCDSAYRAWWVRRAAERLLLAAGSAVAADDDPHRARLAAEPALPPGLREALTQPTGERRGGGRGRVIAADAFRPTTVRPANDAAPVSTDTP